MSKIIIELKNLCMSYGLLFSDKGNGHVQIKGHGIVVNYYPLSKHKTVFCDGVTTKGCTPYDAITICRKKGKVGLKPKNKHIKENPPQVTLGVQHSPPTVKYLYDGDEPMWGGTGMIMCWPDLLRIKAMRLLEQADNMENPECYKDPVEGDNG